MKNIFWGVIFVSILLLCSLTGQAEVVIKEKKSLSLQLYSLREDIEKDYDSTIKKVAEIGFKSVEAAGYDNGKFYGKTPQEFKASLEAVGLTALSSHATILLTEAELLNKDFEAALEWWAVCLDASKEAGMEYVVAPSMKMPKTLDALKTYCQYYDEVGQLAKEKGLKFGYHNHDFELKKVEDEVMLDYMIENTNPEYVFFQMDVYWMVRGSKSPVDYFCKYPKRFKLLHIKDDKELGESGMVGFDAIFRHENTEKAGVEHLIVEVEQYNFTPTESVKKSCDYLQSLDNVKASYVK